MQLALGDVSVKDLSIQRQKLTHKSNMGMRENNAGPVTQWETGVQTWQTDRNHRHSRGLVRRSPGDVRRFSCLRPRTVPY